MNRIRELAQQKGKTDVVARIDKLLGKEQSRYDRKKIKMWQQRQRALSGDKKASKKTGGKEKVKGEKEKEDKDEDALEEPNE